jgi:UDP-MurNAc hydroxylase
MKINLINHASLFIEDGPIGFLTDPWFFGKVFNDSWSLEFETSENDIIKVLDKTTHLYISHEHPDHMHFPTLKKIVTQFKKSVTVFVQDLPRKEVINALKKVGFQKIVEVKHREFFKITDKVSIYLYSVFPVDSACGYISVDNDKCTVLLNLNDTDLCNYDLKKIKKDLKKIDVLFNQFSFATYNGNPNYELETKRSREDLISSYIIEQKFFKPKFSIPFASFSYFCTEDNMLLNKYKTNLIDLRNKLLENKLRSKILLPGDSINLSEVEKFKEINLKKIETLKQITYSKKLQKVCQNEILESFNKCYENLSLRYPKFVIGLLGDFNIYCPDINLRINCNFRNKVLSTNKSCITPDITVYSQPLFYAFSNSWGMNSLTISGRLLLSNKQRKFMFLRILLALGNSNMNFKFNKKSATTYKFLFRNFGRCFFQIFARLKTAILWSEELNSSIK